MIPQPEPRAIPFHGPRLPAMICSYGATFRVRVRVGKAYLEHYVPKDAPGALDLALRQRAKLLDAAARLPRPALSNTGIAGICESYKWNKTRFVHGFYTSATLGSRRVTRFIRYGRTRTRAQALEMARRLRSAWTGKTLEALSPEVAL